MESRISTQTERPSAWRAAFGGLLSGALSGALMTGIVAAISPLIGGTAFLATLASTAPLMIPAAALFTGIMAVKRVMFDAPEPASSMRPSRSTGVPLTLPGGHAPTIAPVIMADSPEAAPDAPTKQWATGMNRTDDTPNRIQQILANGALSDKDRASAILSAREAADTAPRQL